MMEAPAEATPALRLLDVYSNDRLVGRLEANNDLWRFAYAPQWREWTSSYDLSPHILRSNQLVIDGGTKRPVQWFFDNLLPEDRVREAIASSAKLVHADAFGMLEYFGAESAGSLTLVRPDTKILIQKGWQKLSDAELSQRIRNLPRVPIATTSPKRMSLAGAQHKLLVGWDGSSLAEPLGSTPSTHILKPESYLESYPLTVINEYAMMTLARRLELNVPEVFRHYCPEPVYLVKRFDRQVNRDGEVDRLHMIDVCQLLNTAPVFKYQQATLDSLSRVVDESRNRIATRLGLFRWLLFNLLIGNHDNHLKNISLLVSSEGTQLAPAYDLLSTAVYHTKDYPMHDMAPWPEVELAITLPGNQGTFSRVTRAGVLQAGHALGLSLSICEREVNAMLANILPEMDAILADVEIQNLSLPAPAQVNFGGELRLLRGIRYGVIAEMVKKLV